MALIYKPTTISCFFTSLSSAILYTLCNIWRLFSRFFLGKGRYEFIVGCEGWYEKERRLSRQVFSRDMPGQALFLLSLIMGGEGRVGREDDRGLVWEIKKAVTSSVFP